MTELLNFYVDHPVLSVIVLMLVAHTVIGTFRSPTVIVRTHSPEEDEE